MLCVCNHADEDHREPTLFMRRRPCDLCGCFNFRSVDDLDDGIKPPWGK